MITEETISRVKSSLQATKSFLTLEVIERFEKENAGLKKNLERYSQKFAEQEETIDAQDDKINFYVSKMNENILKRQELEKENAKLKSEIKQIIERERVVPEHYLCEMIEKNKELKAENKTILEDNDTLNKWVDELKAQNEKMKNMYNCENSQQMNGEFFCPYFDYYGSMTCCNCNKWKLKGS